MAFLAGTVKPAVDAAFLTRPSADDTVLIGSSMGGVISLHAWLTRPDVFGHAGIMSPAFWTNGGFSLRQAQEAHLPAGRVWVDIGGRESPEFPDRMRAYWDEAHAFADTLSARGLGERLRFQADPAAPHHESAWAARLPAALRFLLTGL